MNGQASRLAGLGGTDARPEVDLIDTDVAIETPEHIVFRHRVAGPARRGLAHFVDHILCTVIFSLGLLLFIGVAMAVGSQFGIVEAMGALQGAMLLLMFVIEWLYFALFEAFRGATPGKIALGMQVVTVAGEPIGFSQAALRNLLRAADALPFAYGFGAAAASGSSWVAALYPAGVVAMLCTRRFQRIGDLVAGTMVVVVDRSDRARAIDVPPPTMEEAAQLPGHLTLDADERAALELFLRRRKLPPAREYELAEMVAPSLARRHSTWLRDPVRLLALLYDRARSAGRGEGPPSSRSGLDDGSNSAAAPPGEHAPWP